MSTPKIEPWICEAAGEIQKLNGDKLDRHCGIPLPNEIAAIIARHIAAAESAPASLERELVEANQRLTESHAKLYRERDELIYRLRDAYNELNEIHARDGVPYTHMGTKASVSQEWFTAVVEKARVVLRKYDEAKSENSSRQQPQHQ